MSKTLILEIPDDVFETVSAVAKKRGLKSENVALEFFVKNFRRPATAKEKKAGIREMFGTWQSGQANAANNEQIDDDLARAYADNHED